MYRYVELLYFNMGCDSTLTHCTAALGVNLDPDTLRFLSSQCICLNSFRDMDSSRAPLSEAEFEEIMNRNRAISSSAISRAVSDASAGVNTHTHTHTHSTNGWFGLPGGD